VATGDAVIAFGLTLPRSYEALVRDQRKLRVGRIVYAALSRDETVLGFGFPRDERDALVASDPATFRLPARASDLRYQWCEAHLDQLDDDEMRELVLDAWCMCVPTSVAHAELSRRTPSTSSSGVAAKESRKRLG
jgi:hypothetical protein